MALERVLLLQERRQGEGLTIPAFCHCCRITGKMFGEKGTPCVDALLTEEAGACQAVTAIIAGPHKDRHMGFCAVGKHLLRMATHMAGGVLHQCEGRRMVSDGVGISVTALCLRQKHVRVWTMKGMESSGARVLHGIRHVRYSRSSDVPKGTECHVFYTL